MHLHWSFHGCENHLKSEMRAYWEKEVPRLDRLMKHFPDQLKEMWLTVRRVRPPELFETKVVVQLPTQTLVAEKSAESWMESFDKAADTLGMRIKRHKEKLRGEWALRRRRRRREELTSAGPHLTRDRNQTRRKEFFALLGPLLERHKHQIRRELRILEMDEEIRRNEWTAEDIVDEILVRAWDRFAGQSDHAALDVWIMTILQEVFDEIISRTYQESLDVPLLQPAEPLDEDNYDDFFFDHELATLADVLPNGEDTATWDAFERKEQRRRLEQTLAKLEPRRRQAFLQHVLEGFNVAEIASMQNREEREVAADIEDGRATLRREIGSSGQDSPESVNV